MRLLLLSIFSALLLISCGGGDDSAPDNGGGGGGGDGSVQTPVAVSVAEGQSLSGINITVPSGTPALNAEVLGVTDLGSGGSAQNTGDEVRRGTAATVLMFGKGLSGNVQVRISGPADITVSNIVTRTATDDTPGVSFDIVVSPNAALGSRTVFLQDPAGQITSFTGGLEVTQ